MNLRSRDRQHYLFFIITGISLILSVKLLYFIKQQAVNLLYSDHWTYLKPLLEDQGALSRFTYQHGPHRQGLGFLISGYLLEISNWNTNLDSYFMGIVLILSNLAFLYLLRLLNGKISITDFIPSILILSPLHYETILLAPNSSHSIVPFFLIIISCFGFIIKNKIIANIYTLVLAYLLLFTGFGVFAGLILFAIVNVRYILLILKQRDILLCLSGLLFTCLSLFHYFFTYNIHFATYDFTLNAPTGSEYLRFLCFLWAGVFQIRPPFALIIGALVVSSMVFALLLNIYQLKKSLAISNQISLYLIVSALIYTIATTTGRISTGEDFAQGSRYMTLAITGILGIYILISSLKNFHLISFFNFILFVFSLNNINLDTTHKEVLEGFQNIKRRFLTAYSPNKTLAENEATAGVILLGATEERFQIIKSKGVHFKNSD